MKLLSSRPSKYEKLHFQQLGLALGSSRNCFTHRIYLCQSVGHISSLILLLLSLYLHCSCITIFGSAHWLKLIVGGTPKIKHRFAEFWS